MLIRCRCGKMIPLAITLVGKRVNCPQCRGAMFSIGTGRLGNKNDFAYRLFIARGPHHVGVQIPLCGNGLIEIGRIKGVQILLPGERVSRNHCTLSPMDDGWRITDTKSANGTFINNKRLTQSTILELGDVVSVGKYEMVYEAMRLPEDRPPIQQAPAPLLDQVPQPANESEDAIIDLTDEDMIEEDPR